MLNIPYDERPYRPCVGIFLINCSKQVFGGRRIDSRAKAWQMPQGGIDPGETVVEACMREMAEEIGTSSAEFKEYASKMAFAMPYFNDLQLEVRVGDGPLVRSFHKEYFSNQDFGAFVYTLAALGSSTAIEFGEAIAQIASV